MNDAKHVKNVAKMLADGKDIEMVCRLTSENSKLGRSSIVDLNKPVDGWNLRQVDHRTLRELIINNTKYLLKN